MSKITAEQVAAALSDSMEPTRLRTGVKPAAVLTRGSTQCALCYQTLSSEKLDPDEHSSRCAWRMAREWMASQ